MQAVIDLYGPADLTTAFATALEGWPHTMDLADDVNQYCRHMMTEFLDRCLPLPD